MITLLENIGITLIIIGTSLYIVSTIMIKKYDRKLKMKYIMKDPFDSVEAREEAWTDYSDTFKDKYGVRPRNEYTYNIFMNGTVKEYCQELKGIKKIRKEKT